MNTPEPHGPNFLVVGAAKSGTTSLSYYLRQHPDIFFAREKESHYFLFPDGAPDYRGPRDQEEFVPLIISDRERYLACFSAGASAAMRGEASVYYLSDPKALRNALDFDGQMKFIAVLRDPAERSFSAWSHMMRDGREPVENFLTAFELESERVAAHWSPGFFYESMSLYGKQVGAALEVVPRGQLHIVLYEDLVERTDETLAGIFSFLGVRNVDIASERVMNPSGNPRFRALNHLLTQRNPVKNALKRVIPYEAGTAIAQRVASWNLKRRDLNEEDRKILDQRFGDDIAQLGELLGRDLRGWGGRGRVRR
ncbi:MAG: sulfotransferase [Tetrasphaera sp.]